MVLRSAGVAHYASAGKTGCGIMKVFTPFAWRINVMTASIECVQGDISRQQDLEAVVNAANAQLQPGGGVAGALHRAAGPELARRSEERPVGQQSRHPPATAHHS